eukprot:5246393-Prorocentrum_lima.AAC.1
MTSSLVGSEMCIRDSVSLLRESGPEFMDAFAAAGWRMEAVSKEFDAVSYTHLTLPTICSV